jgi:hypothetical protein
MGSAWEGDYQARILAFARAQGRQARDRGDMPARTPRAIVRRTRGTAGRPGARDRRPDGPVGDQGPEAGGAAGPDEG